MNTSEYNKNKDNAFAAYMSMTATKMIISMLPPSEHTEAVIRAAFEAGYGCGSVSAVTSFIKEMEKKYDRDQ